MNTKRYERFRAWLARHDPAAIAGTSKSGGNCPVANFLYETTRLQAIEVDAWRYIKAWRPGSERQVRVVIPWVNDFATRFDQSIPFGDGGTYADCLDIVREMENDRVGR